MNEVPGEDKVLVEQLDGGVLVLSLHQPAKKNAIDAAMAGRLADLLRAADLDPQVKVVVLRGAGDTFSSGGDLSQSGPGEATVETARDQLRRYLELVRVVRQVAVPVIAMVDGVAVGGAFSLMLACDLVTVSDRVRVIPAFCAIGIVPEMGMMKLLPQLVGDKVAKEILFTNKVLGAADLVGWHLVNRVLAPADLLDGTLELAGTVAAMPAASIAVTKGILNGAYDVGLEQVMQAESTASPFCTQTAGFREATARFRR
ncbi:MAG: enoyl-CoA hydratase/isomerase family protein [Actinobacteria bacterium]|nr:enoyl-CoA hydratase/isomerase family protein [Actinomycetota bacterium]